MTAEPVLHPTTAQPSALAGLGWGLLGATAFSFTVPMTRIAVDGGGLSPMLVGAGRAVIAAILAAAILRATRQALPQGRQWARLGLVALGCVFGFPVLTSYALTTAPASHGAVVLALLPAATAVLAVLLGKERPRVSFWIAAGLGAVAAVGFAALRSGGIGASHWSDLLLFASVILCGLGYAEGGLLARELGAWQTICWALVVAFPVMAVLAGLSIAQQPPAPTLAGGAAFAYLSVVSMLLGFFAWYRGLGIGPMAQVSQVQLAQPILTLIWAALLLGEQLTWLTLLGAAAVIACALSAVRVRVRPKG